MMDRERMEADRGWGPRIVTSAPGKLMLSGEYAVLEGARALVTAVGRRVEVTLARPGEQRGVFASRDDERLEPEQALAPEVVRTLEHAAAVFGVRPALSSFELTVDVSRLRQGEHKLGLGSSAAASVATAAALAVASGGDVATERRRILDAALAGHRAVAPEGSGADVVASALGGFVVVRRAAKGTLDFEALEAPDLFWRVVWTGNSARTSELVRRVRAFAAVEPRRYESLLRPIADASDGLVRALAERDVGAAIAAIRQHHEAMRALGSAAGVEIVTSALEAVSEAARAEGGAGKPSGAGGGDVAVALLPNAAAAERFDARIRALGLGLVETTLGVEGVRRESSPV